jgi:5-methylcytosine-specific restriction endonuclease McrA
MTVAKKRRARRVRAALKRKTKERIPKALREQVWKKSMGEEFKSKCPTTWCDNSITVYDFHCGHNIPESKGGQTTIDNLIPLCSCCNLSMSNTYTFDEWCTQFKATPKRSFFSNIQRFFLCFKV